MIKFHVQWRSTHAQTIQCPGNGNPNRATRMKHNISTAFPTTAIHTYSDNTTESPIPRPESNLPGFVLATTVRHSSRDEYVSVQHSNDNTPSRSKIEGRTVLELLQLLDPSPQQLLLVSGYRLQHLHRPARKQRQKYLGGEGKLYCFCTRLSLNIVVDEHEHRRTVTTKNRDNLGRYSSWVVTRSPGRKRVDATTSAAMKHTDACILQGAAWLYGQNARLQTGINVHTLAVPYIHYPSRDV